MKLLSLFAKMFSYKPKTLVTIAEEFVPVIEEQPVVIVPAEKPKPKKKVQKAKSKKISL